MIAPVTALGGLVAVGLVLIVIGVVVHVVGTHRIDVTLPPVVTGAIVALIGFNLAPAAKTNFEKAHWSASSRWCCSSRHWRSSAASWAGWRSSWPWSRVTFWR